MESFPLIVISSDEEDNGTHYAPNIQKKQNLSSRSANKGGARQTSNTSDTKSSEDIIVRSPDIARRCTSVQNILTHEAQQEGIKRPLSAPHLASSVYIQSPSYRQSTSAIMIDQPTTEDCIITKTSMVAQTGKINDTTAQASRLPRVRNSRPAVDAPPRQTHPFQVKPSDQSWMNQDSAKATPAPHSISTDAALYPHSSSDAFRCPSISSNPFLNYETSRCGPASDLTRNAPTPMRSHMTDEQFRTLRLHNSPMNGQCETNDNFAPTAPSERDPNLDPRLYEISHMLSASNHVIPSQLQFPAITPSRPRPPKAKRKYNSPDLTARKRTNIAQNTNFLHQGISSDLQNPHSSANRPWSTRTPPYVPATSNANPANRRPRSRPWSGAVLSDMAQTLQYSFPFEQFSEKHGKPESDVFEVFSAMVQLPLCVYSEKGQSRVRMREFREKMKEYRQKMKEPTNMHKVEENRKENGGEPELRKVTGYTKARTLPTQQEVQQEQAAGKANFRENPLQSQRVLPTSGPVNVPPRGLAVGGNNIRDIPSHSQRVLLTGGSVNTSTRGLKVEGNNIRDNPPHSQRVLPTGGPPNVLPRGLATGSNRPRDIPSHSQQIRAANQFIDVLPPGRSKGMGPSAPRNQAVNGGRAPGEVPAHAQRLVEDNGIWKLG